MGELHLEVAEDYATALNGQLDATQVKRAAGTVSLAAEPIRTALRSFVRLVRLNPEVFVRLTFLTTAQITIEHQVAHRTDCTPGLRRWREVADGADAGRLREVLLAIDLGDEVHRYIQCRDDGALRSDLIGRIDWRCGEADTDELEEVLRERVAELCLRELDVPPLEGEQRADNVLQQVLRTCTRRTERVLTHGGLRVVLRRATESGVDRRTLNALMAAAGMPVRDAVGVRRAVGWSAEAALPLPPLIVERPAITALLAAALKAHRIVLVHGGTGMGKTAVARLVARIIGGNWNFMECRGAAPADAADRLRSYAGRPEDATSGVILDDLPDLRLLDEAPDLVAAIRGVFERGENAIATSVTAPPPRVAAALGLHPGLVMSVPLLSGEELLDLVQRAGGDDGWVASVQAASRGGHPQLANAVVTGLRARGWPPQERSADSSAGLLEVGAESEVARRRLAATLPNQAAREILYRASIVAEGFPRDVAIALGAVEPAVRLPGESFDALVGPWVDQVAPDRFRVSPMLHGSGHAVLAPAMISAVHRCVAETLAARSELQADQADNIFFHGLIAKADIPLLAAAIAIIQSDDSNLGRLRPFAPRLAGVDISCPIAPWSPALSVQLRLAQALILSARGVNEGAAEVVRALLEEMRQLPASCRSRLQAVALGKLLFRSGLSHHMPEWPEMLQQLGEVARTVGLSASPADGELGSGDLLCVIFAFSISGLHSVASLANAFERVTALSPSARAEMLAFDHHAITPLVVVLAPWLRERKNEQADGFAAADIYARLARLAALWRERDWAVAFEAAAADIRAEFDDTLGALRGIEAAQTLLGEDRWLKRAKQKILFRLKQDDLVVEVAGPLKVAFGDLPIEAAHLLREAAISASRLGRYDLAARWFSEAAKFASRSSLTMMQAMAVGLVADSAAETWRSGGRGAALAGIAVALDSLAKIDPDAERQSGYAHRIVRHSLLWFAREAGMTSIEVNGQPPALPPGTCSHPEPNESILESSLAPLDHARSFLFQVAARAKVPKAVPDPATRRRGLPILSMEIADRRARLDNAIAAASPELFTTLLRSTIDAVIAARDAMRGGAEDFLRRAEVPIADLADPSAAFYASSAILAFRVVAGASDRPDAADRLRGLLEASQSTIPPGVLHEAFPPGPLPHRGARQPEYCAGLVGRADLGSGELLECCLRLLMHFHSRDFRHVVEEPLAQWAKREWLRFAGERRFALSKVRLSAPAIEAAAAAAEDNLRGLAALVQAAAVGADMSLPPDWQAWLRHVSAVEPAE